MTSLRFVFLALLMLPVEARADTCAPGMWTTNTPHAFEVPTKGKCPQPLRAPVAETTQATLRSCGTVRLCGQLYQRAEVAGDLRLVAFGEVVPRRLLASADLPSPSLPLTMASCQTAIVSQQGALWIELNRISGVTSVLDHATELAPGTTVLVCERWGPLALTYVAGMPGVVARRELGLTCQPQAAAWYTAPGPFCRVPGWHGRTLVWTEAYPASRNATPTRAGSIASIHVLPQGEDIEILGMYTADNGENLWFEAGFGGSSGLVAAEDVQLQPELSWVTAEQPTTACARKAQLVRSTCRALAEPKYWSSHRIQAPLPPRVILPAQTEFLLISQDPDAWTLAALGMAVRVRDTKCLQNIVQTIDMLSAAPSLVAHPGAIESCRQQEAWDRMATGSYVEPETVPLPDKLARLVQNQGEGAKLAQQHPDWFPVPYLWVRDLVPLLAAGMPRTLLKLAINGSSQIESDLVARLEQALQVPANPAVHGTGSDAVRQDAWKRLANAPADAPRNRAARALLAGCPQCALAAVAGCLDAACAGAQEELLAADALLELGLPSMAQPRYLAIADRPETEQLAWALRGYRETARAFAPAPAAPRIFARGCTATPPDEEACLLAVDAALDAGDLAAAAPLLAVLARMGPGVRGHALAAFAELQQDRPVPAAQAYIDALRSSAKSCGVGCELSQALLVQVARAALAADDAAAALVAVRKLQPAMRARYSDVVAATVAATGNAEQTAAHVAWHQALQPRNSTDLVPVLWRAAVLLARCEVAEVEQISDSLAQRAAGVGSDGARLAEIATDEHVDAVLRKIDRLLRNRHQSARDVPELAAATGRNSPCARRAQRRREMQAFDAVRAALPGWSARGVDPADLAREDDACLEALQTAAKDMAARAGETRNKLDELAVDIREVQGDEAELALQVEARLERATDDVLDVDIATPTASWRHLASEIGFAQLLQEMKKRASSDGSQERRNALRLVAKSLLRKCMVATGRVALPDRSAHHAALRDLDILILGAMGCLDHAADAGATPEAQQLLQRYLPALRMVVPEHLVTISLRHVDKPLRQAIEARAAENAARTQTLCIRDRGELMGTL